VIPVVAPTEPTDAALIATASRDASAFGLLFDRHVEQLHRRVMRMVGSRAICDDVVAETFGRAWARRRRFRDTHDGSAWPWLVGIALNVVRDQWRRQRVTSKYRERLGIEYPRAALDPELERVEDRVDASLLLPDVEAALAQLSPGLRAALIARCGHDSTYEEIAKELGCTPLAARVRVSRALRAVHTSAYGGRVRQGWQPLRS
jgi:RNA polymerase sigma factor (sigma-70 family)